MSDIKDFLRDVGYFGVGAAAAILEVGGKAVKALVRKGEKTLHDNQDTVDEIKEKTRKAGERIKAAVHELNKKEEAPTAEDVPETEAPEVESPVAEVPEVETPEVDVPEIEVPEADSPVVPDVIYHAGEPVAPESSPEAEEPAEETEKPEETING